MLLAQMLQRAGLNFVSAKARHRGGGLIIDEIVAPTPEDAKLIEAWAESEGYPAKVRVATAEEKADFEARC